MNTARLKSLIKTITQNGCIQFSRHCRKRMPERNVTTDDFLNVLSWGEIVRFKENNNHRNFKCEMKGLNTDGDELTLQISVSQQNMSILCITVY